MILRGSFFVTCVFVELPPRTQLFGRLAGAGWHVLVLHMLSWMNLVACGASENVYVCVCTVLRSRCFFSVQGLPSGNKIHSHCLTENNEFLKRFIQRVGRAHLRSEVDPPTSLTGGQSLVDADWSLTRICTQDTEVYRPLLCIRVVE